MSTDEPTTPDTAPPRPAEPLGGEPACMLDRVCPECGRLADTPLPTTCARCGAPLGAPD